MSKLLKVALVSSHLSTAINAYCSVPKDTGEQIRPGPGPQGASLLGEKHSDHFHKGVMSESCDSSKGELRDAGAPSGVGMGGATRRWRDQWEL